MRVVLFRIQLSRTKEFYKSLLKIPLLLVLGFSFFHLGAQPSMDTLSRFIRKDITVAEADYLDTLITHEKINEIRSSRDRIIALILKGRVETVKHRPAEAVSSLMKAIAILDTADLVDLEADAFHRLGYVNAVSDNIEEAFEWYSKALQINAESDSMSYAYVLNDFAILKAQTDQIDEAASLFESIVTFYERNAPTTDRYPGVIGNLAIIKEWQGQYEESRRYYLKEVMFYKTKGAAREVSAAYNNLGGNYLDQNMLDSAEYYLKASYYLSDSLNWLDEKYDAVGNLLNLFVKKQNFEEALEWSKIRFELRDSLSNSENLIKMGAIKEEYQTQIENERAERLVLAKRLEEERSANIQFLGIFLGIVFLFMILFLMGRVEVSETVRDGIVFFAFVLLFEFLLVILDPWIDNLSEGKPLIKLACNVALALCIIPLHAMFEGRMKRALSLKKN